MKLADWIRPCFLPAPHHPALHRETRSLGLRRPGGAHRGEAVEGGEGGKAMEKSYEDPWKTWKNLGNIVKIMEKTMFCKVFFKFESDICQTNRNNNLVGRNITSHRCFSGLEATKHPPWKLPGIQRTPPLRRVWTH